MASTVMRNKTFHQSSKERISRSPNQLVDSDEMIFLIKSNGILVDTTL